MYKQVIVVRKDLNLSKGKLAVQVAHASLGAYNLSDKRLRKKWERGGAKKVVVKVDSQEKLRFIQKSAKSLALKTFLVKDAGKTEISPGTVTALGLGPAEERIINRITGNLKML